MAALLEQIGWGQVDHQPLGRQGQAKPGERRKYALAAFGHSLVAKPDDQETDLTVDGLHLDVDALRLDAVQRKGCNPCDYL